MPGGEYCGGNKELDKHPLLAGDCQGSPATLDSGYTGWRIVSAILSETPSPRICGANHSRRPSNNSSETKERTVAAMEVHKCDNQSLKFLGILSQLPSNAGHLERFYFRQDSPKVNQETLEKFEKILLLLNGIRVNKTGSNLARLEVVEEWVAFQSEWSKESKVIKDSEEICGPVEEAVVIQLYWFSSSEARELL